MPRAIVITCDKCGERMAWCPIDTSWIKDIWHTDSTDSQSFVANDRESGEIYRDLCPECALTVFWMPLVKDANRRETPPEGHSGERTSKDPDRS